MGEICLLQFQPYVHVYASEVEHPDSADEVDDVILREKRARHKSFSRSVCKGMLELLRDVTLIDAPPVLLNFQTAENYGERIAMHRTSLLTEVLHCM